MKYVGWIVTTIGLMVVSAIYSGYALSVLWGWFVVPTFEAPQLSIPSAIGLTMIVGYLTKSISTSESEDDKKKEWGEKLAEKVAVAIIKPTFALAFGAIVSAWM